MQHAVSELVESKKAVLNLKNSAGREMQARLCIKTFGGHKCRRSRTWRAWPGCRAPPCWSPLPKGPAHTSSCTQHLVCPAIPVVNSYLRWTKLSCYSSWAGGPARDHVVLGDPLMGNGHLVNRDGLPEHHYGCAIAPVGDHVLLLGSEGAILAQTAPPAGACCSNGSCGKSSKIKIQVKMVRVAAGVKTVRLLMSWQERLAALRDIGQWELALLIGLNVWQEAGRASHDDETEEAGWRGEGVGAEPSQVSSLELLFL